MTWEALWVMLAVIIWKMIMLEQTKLREWVVWGGLMLFRPHSLDGLAWPQRKESIVAEYLHSLPKHPLCKRISVPQPSRFYPCPSRYDSCKTNCRDQCLEIQFGICVVNLWFHLVKKFKNYGYVVGASFPWKFKLTSEKILSQSANEK